MQRSADRRVSLFGSEQTARFSSDVDHADSASALRAPANSIFNRGYPWFSPGMDDLSQRLEKIESHLAHLEKQYEELNQVAIEQGRLLARLQKECAKVSDSVGTMELERIRANNPKPPHYQA